MYNLLNLVECVKPTSKTFGIAHFGVHSLVHCAFSSPKAEKKIGTLYQFKDT